MVAAKLIVAKSTSRRTIKIDWRRRKLGRLWKSSWAAQTQHAANAVDVLESVNVIVASHMPATLNQRVEEMVTHHGPSLLITRATACTMRTRGELHDSRSGGTAIKLTIVNWRLHQLIINLF